MEVVGAIGAVVGIIDVATRCISFLADVRKRLQETDVSVEFLTGRVSTVRTALSQIHLLVGERVCDELHYQLVLDLDVAIRCCNLLIGTLDEQLSKLFYSDSDSLRFESRVRILFASESIRECQRHLDSQINALNLIITVYNVRSSFQQKRMLEEKEAQKVITQLKDDSSSLLVLYDTASFATKRTQTTTATSKLSINFAFDTELLQHRNYKDTLRSLMRRAKNDVSRAATVEQAETRQQLMASEYIDAELRRERALARRNVKILLVGTESERVVKVLDCSLVSHAERLRYRIAVQEGLIHKLMLAIKSCDMGQLETKQKIRLERTYHTLLTSTPTFPLRRATKRAIQWSATQNYLTDQLDHETKSLFKDTARLLTDYYIPSGSDIESISIRPRIEVVSPANTCQEMYCSLGEFTCTLFQYSSSTHRTSRKNLLAALGEITAIIFTLDLCCYDQALPEDQSTTIMRRELGALRHIVRRAYFQYDAVILLIANVETFKTKIATSPLEAYFTDYAGGSNDSAKAIKYMVQHLRELLADLRVTNIYFLELHDTMRPAHIATIIEDILICKGNDIFGR